MYIRYDAVRQEKHIHGERRSKFPALRVDRLANAVNPSPVPFVILYDNRGLANHRRARRARELGTPFLSFGSSYIVQGKFRSDDRVSIEFENLAGDLD